MPDDVAAPIQAAINLSKRKLQIRVLDEAEQLVSLGFLKAAVAISGVALDSVLENGQTGESTSSQRRIACWRELRDRGEHAGVAPITAEDAQEMIEGVRRLVNPDSGLDSTRTEDRKVISAGKVRGKYRFVRTSSTEFIERKQDEFTIEHQ